MTAEERGREHVFGTIPNVLTMVRLVSTGPLAWLIVTGEYKAACGVFVVSGALDWADGFIARRWPSQASVLGSFLDPVADKVRPLVAIHHHDRVDVGIARSRCWWQARHWRSPVQGY